MLGLRHKHCGSAAGRHRGFAIGVAGGEEMDEQPRLAQKHPNEVIVMAGVGNCQNISNVWIQFEELFQSKPDDLSLECIVAGESAFRGVGS